MFANQSRTELKAFGLLLGFIAVCGTLGTLFFSKMVWLLTNFTFLGGFFLLMMFLLVIGSAGFGIYAFARKTVPSLSSARTKISPYTTKTVSFLKNKKDTYVEETRTNGFIASMKLTKKKEK